MSDFDLVGYLTERKLLIDRALDERLPSASVEPCRVHEAMRYATLSGGKRLRPILALAVADLDGAPPERILDSACAIELVHAASLILDDLPAMDNAETRRGQPTTHMLYSEAPALPASGGLLALAFDLVARNAALSDNPDAATSAIQLLASVIGTQGAIQGQHADLAHSGEPVSLASLEDSYRQKASALFVGGLAIPACLLGMSESQREALAGFGTDLGLAFQITDDLLDAGAHGEGPQKTTLVTFLGEEGTRNRVSDLVASAETCLAIFGDGAEPLRMMARYVATRTF